MTFKSRWNRIRSLTLLLGDGPPREAWSTGLNWQRVQIVLWRFFDNRTGQHDKAAGFGAVTATNGLCLRSATPP
jgi:hypothetical protein